MIQISAVSSKVGADVRFGSKADICNTKRHVRFTPNSDTHKESPTHRRLHPSGCQFSSARALAACIGATGHRT